MRTKDELFQEALRHIAARRQRAVTEAERMRAAAYQIHPELREAEEARTQAGLALAMAAARGGDRESAARALEQAAANRDRVFAAAGYAPEDLEPHYTCPVCGDTGTINGARCQCVAEVARSLRRSEINAASPLALCGFDTFLLDRYPTDPDPDLAYTTSNPRLRTVSAMPRASRVSPRTAPPLNPSPPLSPPTCSAS